VIDSGRALKSGIALSFRRHLRTECLPRIRACVELLGNDQIWLRTSANCNSVGNLLLHLCGNVTQWILVTFRNEPDQRDRPAEFATEGAIPTAQLLHRLQVVVDAACECVDHLTTDDLLRERVIQQHFRETGLSAVLHVLEHFSGHAGQIYLITKQITGIDLKFYALR
jgi:uncharacterized damage-inducible protein DinB